MPQHSTSSLSSLSSTQDLQQQSRNSLLTSILGLGFWLLTFVQKEGGKKREKLPFRVGWRSMMIDNCLLVIIYRRGHILEFSVTAESISRSQDCLSVKSCVDTVICNLKLRENAILTFAPIRNIWIKTREPRLKKLICVKILTCQKWNLGEIWYFSWRAAAARELGRAGKIQTDVLTHSYTTIDR